MKKIVAIVFSSSVWFSCLEAYAQCVSLTKGPVVLDVNACKVIDPTKDLTRNADYSFLKGMTASDRTRFLATYQGILVDALVVQSTAVKSGFDPQRGALQGERARFFLQGNALSCDGMNAKRVSVDVNEVCCNGGADIPCLLDTTYLISKPKVIGNKGAAAGDTERMTMEKSPDYIGAAKAMQAKKYDEAVKLFEKLRLDGSLDVRGHFLLGSSYRELNDCSKAIPVLEVVFDRSNKNDVWADQHNIVRRSNYLLARCYARTNQPGRATIILNAYLIEAKKYRPEIERSLKDPDFGFINASKEYRSYTQKAQKIIGSNK